MDRNRFETPVTIFTGLGFPTPVESAAEACALLLDWPKSGRNRAHTVALNACRAALAGEIDAETARSTFMAFARRANLLAPAANDLVAARKADAIESGRAV